MSASTTTDNPRIHPLHYDLAITLSDEFYNEKTNGSEVPYSASLTLTCSITSDGVSQIELDCNSDRIEIFGVSIEKNKNLKLKGVTFEQVKKQVASSSSVDKKKKKRNEKEVVEIIQNRKGLLIRSESEPLMTGKYDIKISFKGVIVPSKKAMSGLFYSIHPKNGTKILCSHFEAQFAHYAFPCFDDWEEKATFQLHLANVNFANSYKCISNMPPKMKNESKKTITFTATPKMAPYLVGLFVGQFENVETTFTSKKDDENEIPINVFYLDSALVAENAKTVLEMTCKILPALEEYFDHSIAKQQLTKVDYLIIPELIIGGGMENWGCITLLEKYSANTSMDMKKLGPFVEILAHELSHFWVGNLVGFSFHIKEGLALYLEKIITDEVLKRPSSIVIKKTTEKKKDLISEIKQGKEEANLSVEQLFSKMFSGVAYTQCYDWICGECVGVLGPTVFRDRLRQMIAENEFGFVKEEEFVNSFK